MQLFDTVLITASSEAQAAAFRRLIARRQEHGLYPREIDFEVVADPPGWPGGHRGRDPVGAAPGCSSGEHPTIPRAFLGTPAHPADPRRGREPPAALLRPRGEALRAAAPVLERAAAPGGPRRPARSLLQVPLAPGRDRGHHRRRVHRLRRGQRAGGARARSSASPSRPPSSRARATGSSASTSTGSAWSTTTRRPRSTCWPSTPSSRAPATAPSTSAWCPSGPRPSGPSSPWGRCDVEGGSLIEGLEAGRVRFDLYLEVLTACLEGLSFEAFWERVGPASALPETLGAASTRPSTPSASGALSRARRSSSTSGASPSFPRACRDLLAHQARPFYEADGGEIRPSVTPAAIVHNSTGVSARRARPRRWSRPAPIASFGTLGGDNLVVGLDGARLALRPAGGRHPRRAPTRATDRVVVVLSARDSFKVASDPARPRLLRPSPRRRGSRSAGSGGRTSSTPTRRPTSSPRGCSAVSPTTDLIAGYLAPRPGLGGRAFRAARRLSLYEIQERDDVAAARGPTGRAAPGAAPRALPTGARVAGGERPGFRVHLRRGTSRALAPGVARAHRRPGAAGLPRAALPRRSPRGERPPDAAASRRSSTSRARRTGPPAPRPSRRTRSCGRGPRCGWTSPGAGPTPRPTPCATAAGW